MPEKSEKDNLFWAYLAGFVDGEGCIGARLDNRLTHAFRSKLHIMNTNREVLLFIKNNVGFGSLYASKVGIPNQKDAYTWEVCNRQCLRVLLKIRPYLVVKAKQADEVIKMQELIISTPRHVDKNMRELRLQTISNLHLLNKKGANYVST